MHRHHETRGLAQAALKRAHHAGALFRVVDLRVHRIDIVRQVAFLHQPMARIFISGVDAFGINAQILANGVGELFGLFEVGDGFPDLRSDEIDIVPDRLAVLAPIERKGPTRQAFTRIPFCLLYTSRCV